MADSSNDIMGILQRIIAQYQADGSYGKGSEAVLDRQKARSVSSANQSAVSAGLSGTSVPAGYDKKWEEEIGAPQRLQIEDSRTQLLSQAMMAKAGYLQQQEQMEADKEMQNKQLGVQMMAYKPQTPQSSMSSIFDKKTPSKTQSSQATQHIGANKIKAPVFGTLSSKSSSSWSSLAGKKTAATPAAPTAPTTPAAPEQTSWLNRFFSRMGAQGTPGSTGAYY